MLVIPAIDLYQGRCVRLFQGRYDQVTFYDHDPVELAKHYRDQGTSWLHVVDLDGAKDGGGKNMKIIGEISAITGLQLQSGGGVRTETDVVARFKAGVDRLIIGSLAIAAPDRVNQWLDRYGTHRIALALDVRTDLTGVPRVATHGWREQSQISLWEVVKCFGPRLKHVLCTDISRDGAMAGPNLGLYRACVEKYPGLAFQASGGVRHSDDIQALGRVGVAGTITGKALLDGNLTFEEIEPFLQNA